MLQLLFGVGFLELVYFEHNEEQGDEIQQEIEKLKEKIEELEEDLEEKDDEIEQLQEIHGIGTI